MYMTLPNSEKEGKVYDLATYMQIRMKDTKEHEIWALKFFICECLNFINVICQIFITDAFLGGEFSTYGTEVRKLDFYFFVKSTESRTEHCDLTRKNLARASLFKVG